MQCTYCNSPETRAREIVRNKFAWAFPTNIPIVPGHVLICPIRCVPRLEDLRTDEIEALFELRMKLRRALQETFGATGFNYAWNEGEVAGQSIPHLHFHMLPRKEGDTGIMKYEPRKFLYRPGSRETTPQDELLAITELVKRNL